MLGNSLCFAAPDFVVWGISAQRWRIFAGLPYDLTVPQTVEYLRAGFTAPGWSPISFDLAFTPARTSRRTERVGRLLRACDPAR